MYFLLNMGIFQCHVSFQGCMFLKFWRTFQPLTPWSLSVATSSLVRSGCAQLDECHGEDSNVKRQTKQRSPPQKNPSKLRRPNGTFRFVSGIKKNLQTIYHQKRSHRMCSVVSPWCSGIFRSSTQVGEKLKDGMTQIPKIRS